jgi:hypothetical protein
MVSLQNPFIGTYMYLSCMIYIGAPFRIVRKSGKEQGEQELPRVGKDVHIIGIV